MFKGYGVCPYTGNAVDSPPCRQCQWFFRPGTYTFIWCSHPVQETTKSKLPANKKTATRKPVRLKQKAKGNYTQIKTDTTPKKRGRPKKAK